MASAAPTTPVEPAKGGPSDEHAKHDFLKGVAISVWQNSGSANTNWGKFCRSRGKFFGLYPNIMDRDINEVNSDFWNNYEEDFTNAKNMGCNAFRLSLEWDRIEPQQGVIDQAAIQRYHDMFTCLEKLDMVASVTLHHFVHPLWWDNLGGFEKRENLHHFVKFCELAAAQFGRRVLQWSTFNEPTTYIVCGFLMGVHPPGRILNFWLAGKVLTNILHAHTLAYRAMKNVPGAKDIQIGIVHHTVDFMPKSNKMWYLRALSWWSAYWWGKDVVPNYFVTGEVKWLVPLFGKAFHFKEEGGKPPLDFWGINYYTRGVIAGYGLPAKMKGELVTDMGYNLYPTGLYEGIVRGSQLGVPIYITETGAADKSEDEAVRKACVESYFGQCMRAVREGYDVRGFFYWTLVDNFEWNCGNTMKFGLYSWSKEEGRKLKEGGRLLSRLYQGLPVKMPELHEYLKKNFHITDYELNLDHEQLLDNTLPVAYYKGKYVHCEPLSPLHLRIGFEQDIGRLSFVRKRQPGTLPFCPAGETEDKNEAAGFPHIPQTA